MSFSNLASRKHVLLTSAYEHLEHTAFRKNYPLDIFLSNLFMISALSAVYNNGTDIISLIFISSKATEEVLDDQTNAICQDPIAKLLLE